VPFGLRPLYHDLSDNQSGYDQGSEIVLLNTELRWQRKSIHLHQLDILKMTSLRPRNLFLNLLSWRLAMGLYRSSFHSGYRLNPQISAAAGYSYPILQHNSTLSILPSARLNLTPIHGSLNIIQLGGTLEYLSQQRWGTTHLMGSYYHSISSRFSSYKIKLSQTFRVNKDQDFRVGFECKERCRKNDINFNIGFATFL